MGVILTEPHQGIPKFGRFEGSASEELSLIRQYKAYPQLFEDTKRVIKRKNTIRKAAKWRQ